MKRKEIIERIERKIEIRRRVIERTTSDAMHYKMTGAVDALEDVLEMLKEDKKG